MNTIAFHIPKRTIFLLLLVAGMVQLGCKKNSGGTPTITDVRAVDSTKRDSLFTKALPGTLIVIQGSNLGGLQAVYFNDTAASFNPAFATSTNIVVTIPSTAQTLATNPNAPSLIKVVTDHGTATYSFSLYLPPPTITALLFDDAGTHVAIVGTNLLGASKITFPGGLTSPSFTINSSSIITATIPPGSTLQDSIRVYCTFGTAAYSYPPPMTITSVSNENAVAGTTLTINGTNFVGITQVTFPGGIAGTNLQKVSISQLTVTVPAGITAGDSLRVTGTLGTTASPFVYDNWLSPTTGFLANFDGTTSQWSPPANNPYFGWSQQGWVGTFVTNSTTFPNGTGYCVEINPASAKAAGDNSWYQDNNSIITNTATWVTNSSAPIGNYALKFEINVTNWTAGAIWVGTSFPNWSYLATYAPWKTTTGGSYSSTGWVTVTIPLTSFLAATNNVYTSTGSTPPDIPTLIGGGGGLLMLMYANDGTTTIPANSFTIGIDNVRIVPVK